MDMALTRDFKETIQERARRDAAFREALLKEAVDAMLSGDVETSKTVLRDYINATVGFDKLVDCNSWLAFKFSGALRLGSGRTDKTNSVRGEVLEP
jgi:hypothetical protein